MLDEANFLFNVSVFGRLLGAEGCGQDISRCMLVGTCLALGSVFTSEVKDLDQTRELLQVKQAL